MKFNWDSLFFFSFSLFFCMQVLFKLRWIAPIFYEMLRFNAANSLQGCFFFFFGFLLEMRRMGGQLKEIKFTLVIRFYDDR